MKKVVKAALKGVSLSAVIFVVTCIFKGVSLGEEVFMSGVGMAYSCIAVLAIGAGFGIPSLIYRTELPTGLKILIHMGVGVIVMLAASIAVGWIDLARGWLPCLIVAAVQIALAFLVWALSFIGTKKDAKRMNEKIAEKE